MRLVGNTDSSIFLKPSFKERNAILNSDWSQFTYCLRLIVLHFCMCHGLYTFIATRHICVT